MSVRRVAQAPSRPRTVTGLVTSVSIADLCAGGVAVVVLAVLVRVWISGMAYDLHSVPLSPRYNVYAIPSALSVMLGRPFDYLAYRELMLRFIQPDARVHVDPVIAEVLAQPPALSGQPWRSTADDHGTTLLTLAAFRLFGARQASIYVAVLGLFSASIVLALLDLWRRPGLMLAVLGLVLGLLALVPIFGVSDQFSTVSEPRFLGFVSIVSTSHVLICLFQRERLSRLSWATLIGQAMLIGFARLLRGSEAWQVAAIVSALPVAVAVGLRSQGWRGAIQPTLAVIGLVVVVMAMTAAANSGFSSDYAQTATRSHIVWHNALMGLAVDPDIAAEYKMGVTSDASVAAAVREYLKTTGQNERRDAIFPGSEDTWLKNATASNWERFDWIGYEAAARELWWKIVREDPGRVVRLFTVRMPQMLAANAFYLSSTDRFLDDHYHVGQRPDARFLLVGKTMDRQTRVSRDAFLRLFRPDAVLALLAAVGFLTAYRLKVDAASGCGLALAVLGWVALWSLGPPFLAAPVMMYDLLTIQVGVALVYGTIVVGGSSLLSRLARRWTLTAWKPATVVGEQTDLGERD